MFISQLKTFVENHKEFLPFGIDLPVMYGLSSLGDGADGLIEGSSNRNPTRSYLSFNF
ncbi:hypothetical protein IJU97_00360 [bacterium]|nr:hypothetical protein [bacterium]